MRFYDTRDQEPQETAFLKDKKLGHLAPESTLIETLTLGNGVAYSTDVPVTVAPDSKSSNPSSSHVGAILSGVAAIFVLLLIVWFCGRRTHSHRSRGSSRQSRSESSGSSSSNGSNNASGSSRNGGPGSAASDMAEGQWKQPPQPMPGMPHPVAGRWAIPSPGLMGPPPGMGPPGMGPPGVVGIRMPAGHGGPPPIMGRGSGPLPMHGGPPPPIVPIVGSGGPPPMPQ
ncbi:hypothetical protein CHU98_g5863 [Xylaria longipes]|nr:hypothetical protein CHU98_g5863 [Xylaria longipes]